MIQKILNNKVKEIIDKLYSVKQDNVQFQKTRKEFNGDITLVVFSFLKASKKGPEETAVEIGDCLIKELNFVIDYNVVQGFLNLVISKEFWFREFVKIFDISNYGIVVPDKDSPNILVEYSSPNTNKPIHLGHLRNNFLGYSVAEILKASGRNVKKVQIINDRGIHICKSMVAWQDYGNNETPESSGIKGDHLVGKYYVEFEKQYRNEVSNLVDNGIDLAQAKKEAPIMIKAKEMLLKWEAKDSDILALWKRMNNWVYSGFDTTYKMLGVDFDKNYYESETYVLGKEVVGLGINKDVFYKKDDGSVWIDLSGDNLDQKLILRSDGTAVYITQDIGTAIQRYKDFKFSHMVYTVANEQDYHFKVLFLILSKLGYSWAKNCIHLSYGMVDLPSGRMKSREGTVVDADDFVQEMVATAKKIAQDLGKLDKIDNKEADQLYKTIGLGALKYFLLKVDPKKRMLFNPEESIDFNGNTGPFIQYTYARIQSLKRKYDSEVILPEFVDINAKEQELIKNILEFPSIIQEAAVSYSPSVIANFAYNLVKEYNNYYQSISILNSDNSEVTSFRLALSLKVSEIIKTSMRLLGVNVPDRM
tara:strand:+ start:246 stop:2015 length:1770 start_codon:yes stop_codon:yes gene_type:complete